MFNARQQVRENNGSKFQLNTRFISNNSEFFEFFLNDFLSIQQIQWSMTK